MLTKHRNIAAFVFYFLFFALLFIQLPLRHEISGNCDSWLALTYSAHTLEAVKSFFTGEETGRAMFPAENPLAYGESAPGMQILIMFLKASGLSDSWANYLFITLLLALTAFGIFVWADERVMPANRRIPVMIDMRNDAKLYSLNVCILIT